MKLIAAITMYNEIDYGPHVYKQLDNAIELGCYDDIVVLDDGSTDGTWDVLEEYANKYTSVHVFRSNKNSILNKTTNRWYDLYKLLRQFNPTWVHIRAADMLFSHPTSYLLRPQLERFLTEGVVLVGTPIVHLWRSENWYRTDGPWGKQARNNYYKLIYKYDTNASWSTDNKKSGMHQDMYLPTSIKNDKMKSLNDGYKEPFPMVALHLGHTTHEKKARKFDWSMESATVSFKAGRSFGMPPPGKMPHPINWMKHTGYPGFVEWGAFELQKASPIWFKDEIEYDVKPIPQSFYETIKRWNPTRAEEYKKIFNLRWENKDG